MRTQVGILLFAHGASDPEWAAPFLHMQEEIRRLLPNAAVEIGFLERSQPDFRTAIASLAAKGCLDVTIAPLFLARGSHLKHDLPEFVAQAASAFPNLSIRVMPALGEIPEFIRATSETLAKIIAEANVPTTQKPLTGA